MIHSDTQRDKGQDALVLAETNAAAREKEKDKIADMKIAEKDAEEEVEVLVSISLSARARETQVKSLKLPVELSSVLGRLCIFFNGLSLFLVVNYLIDFSSAFLSQYLSLVDCFCYCLHIFHLNASFLFNCSLSAVYAETLLWIL